jgi:uncharacterized protein YdhG (YjbR/CyaY superfamily)
VTDKPASVDDYIAGFPPNVAARLIRVRELLHAAMPDSSEQIRYGMPAVMLRHRYGLHYAGWKKHIGLYPVPVFDEPLEAEVSPYRSGKDSVNLPHNRPLPEDVITRIGESILARSAG